MVCRQQLNQNRTRKSSSPPEQKIAKHSRIKLKLIKLALAHQGQLLALFST